MRTTPDQAPSAAGPATSTSTGRRPGAPGAGAQALRVERQERDVADASGERRLPVGEAGLEPTSPASAQRRPSRKRCPLSRPRQRAPASGAASLRHAEGEPRLRGDHALWQDSDRRHGPPAVARVPPIGARPRPRQPAPAPHRGWRPGFPAEGRTCGCRDAARARRRLGRPSRARRAWAHRRRCRRTGNSNGASAPCRRPRRDAAAPWCARPGPTPPGRRPRRDSPSGASSAWASRASPISSLNDGGSGQSGATSLSPPATQPTPGGWLRCSADTTWSRRQGGPASPPSGPQLSTNGPAPVTAAPGGPASSRVTATVTCSARCGQAIPAPAAVSATTSNRYSPYSGSPATVRPRDAAGLLGPHGTAPDTPVFRCPGVR